jgi:hypothetical protein
MSQHRIAHIRFIGLHPDNLTFSGQEIQFADSESKPSYEPTSTQLETWVVRLFLILGYRRVSSG